MTTDGKAISAIDLDGLSAAEKRALLADRLRRRHKRRFPVSFPQQRLWFLHRLAPDDPAYNIGNAARINGLLDLEIWRDSAAEVDARFGGQVEVRYLQSGPEVWQVRVQRVATAAG